MAMGTQDSASKGIIDMSVDGSVYDDGPAGEFFPIPSISSLLTIVIPDDDSSDEGDPDDY